MIDAATDTPVLVQIEGRVGHLTLNRPKRINALDRAMIQALHQALEGWASDPAVELVLIDGAGERGLCAGGDIRAVYEGIHGRAGDPGLFWDDEYAMNAAIAHYPKPYVAYMDGIVFGGGVGVSAHGNVRIVTERSQVAMPETAIGLCPDVGALYLLSRAPGELGTRAALTGARMDAATAIHAGLADHYLPSSALPALTASLVERGAAALQDAPWEPAAEAAVAPWVQACYSQDSIEDILQALRGRPEPEALADAELIASMSPTALKVTLRAIRNAAGLTVDQVLDQDLRVCSRFLEHPDFAEGIRAQIIDKDRNPRWNPARLEDVADEGLASFFAPLVPAR